MADPVAIVPEIDDDEGILEPPAQNFGKVISRHRKLKKAAKAALGLTGLGVQGGQIGAGVSTIGVVAGTAGTIGTGGTALLIGGGVATVAGSALAARSTYRTNNHINNLKHIQMHWQAYRCDAKGDTAHAYIGDQILPYIIRKKRSKLSRKARSILPGVGAVETVRGALKNLYKRKTGRLHKNRTFAAEWLAVHLISHNCELAEAIVSELYSPKEMEYLKTLDSDEVAPLLMDKMKSV